MLHYIRTMVLYIRPLSVVLVHVTSAPSAIVPVARSAPAGVLRMAIGGTASSSSPTDTSRVTTTHRPRPVPRSGVGSARSQQSCGASTEHWHCRAGQGRHPYKRTGQEPHTPQTSEQKALEQAVWRTWRHCYTHRPNMAWQRLRHEPLVLKTTGGANAYG
jgi:hypothetical protein